MKRLTAVEAARLLGVLVSKLKLLEKQGLIHSLRGRYGLTYSREEIESIIFQKGMTAADAAAQVSAGIQRDILSFIASTRKFFRLAIGAFLIYLLSISAVTTMFILNPIKTAEWLGIVKNSTQISQVTQARQQRVLGVTTGDLVPTTNPLQTFLEPVTRISLGLVRSFNPNAYAQVSQRAIIDPNDILALDPNGAITPERPINLPQSSLLQVGSSEVITNLNSEYLQGRQPGTKDGDLAIIGESLFPVPPPIVISSATTTPLDLTDLDLTGIADSILADSSLTLTTSSPLSGGGELGLGGSLTLTCPTCITSLANDSLTFVGNTGSGKVSLGETLTLLGSGINTVSYSGSTLTIASTEADTLASITARGDETATSLTLNGGITTTSSTALTLDSGTTGEILLGTGDNPKNINIGNTTGTTAVNVNSGTGNVNFTIGPTSSSEKVQIGNSTTATPDLLVLDNGTADPMGTNGASYYNTSTNKFRCYENSSWKDCDSSGLDNIKTSQSNTLASLSTTETSYLSVTITPTSASKNIWITADMTVINNTNNVMITFRIRRGSDCTGTQVGNDITAGSVKNAILPGTTGVMNFIDSPNTTSATTYQLCALATNSVGATSDGVGGRQITAAEVKLGADLAEVYNSLDTTITPGEVITVDAAIDGGVKRSEQAYQNDLLGVVSTNPGKVLSGVSGPGKPILVALSGRVPVKVNTEGGVIKAGDYLTSSSVPGVAMKATRAGAIIGTAMTSFNGEGVGQILVFVKNGFSLGDNTEGINTLMKLLGGSGVSNFSSPADVSSIAINSAEPVSTGDVVEKNLIGYITQTVSNLFKSTVEFFDTVIFNSDVSFLGRPTFNSDSGGFAEIKAGAFEVTVNFDQEYETTPIITGSPDVAVIYAISDVNTKGFKIKLIQAETRDIRFAWTVTAVKDAKTFVGTPAPVPSYLPEPTF